MQFISKYIRPFLLPCLYCGSLRAEEAGLCQSCFAALKVFEGEPLHEIHEAPYPIYSFYDWRPGESDILSRLFLSMKGAGGKRFWQAFAPAFLARRMAFPLTDDRPVRVVPAPSSLGRRDHAFLWGQALAEELQTELCPCLKKSELKHQRGASRDQRRRLRLELNENYSDLPRREWSRYRWIFADDILTTGATAFAAYEALGSPPHFEVWVLGRRSLSCGASTDLL